MDEWWLNPDKDLYIRYNLERLEWELDESDREQDERKEETHSD